MKTLLTILLCVVAMQGMAQIKKPSGLRQDGLYGGLTQQEFKLWQDSVDKAQGNSISVSDPAGLRLSSNLPLNSFVWQQQVNGKSLLSISSPNSNNVVTVKFSPKDVTFINDSTFTFKVK